MRNSLENLEFLKQKCLNSPEITTLPDAEKKAIKSYMDSIYQQVLLSTPNIATKYQQMTSEDVEYLFEKLENQIKLIKDLREKLRKTIPDFFKNDEKASPITIAMRKLLEQFTLLLEKENLFITPYQTPNLSHFANLNATIQKQVYREFEAFYELCKDIQARGGDLRDDKSFVQNALSKFGLTHHLESLDFIEEGDVVEIYNNKFQQVFRNLRFLELSNYDLETLLCYPWYVLFERNKQITAAIFQKIQSTMQEGRNLSRYAIAPHLLKETYALKQGLFTIEEKYLCALENKHGERLGLTTLRATPCKEG